MPQVFQRKKEDLSILGPFTRDLLPSEYVLCQHKVLPLRKRHPPYSYAG
jgi:hypothetical protein